MKFTLGNDERLKSRKLIGDLYTEGSSLKVYPLRMVYIQREHTSNFIDRNRIKRLLRDSYRHEKSIVYSALEKPYVFMISYLAKDEWSSEEIRSKMVKLLNKFIKEINENEK